jgi:formate dehydrogenase subunit gamma
VSEPTVYVGRFSRSERTLHWVHAAAFFVLLGSGLVLYLPQLSERVGRRPFLKDVHVYTAVAWLVALAAIVVLGDRRGLRRTSRELQWFDADDRQWLRGRGAPQGRFNAGQKLNAAVTAALSLLFVISGGLLWLGERDTAFRFTGTLLVHDWLMWVSLVLLVGHLYLAVIHPATRHALRGITLGTVRYDWAEAHHAKWVRPAGPAGSDPDASETGAGQAAPPVPNPLPPGVHQG